MVSVLEQPDAGEQRVTLHGVKWETYERLLDDLVHRTAPRLVYDQGTLEIISPASEHEEYNRTLALLVEIAAEEMELDIRRLGSTTFKRKDLLKGFEPDSCFYIQSVEEIRGKQRLDLRDDPPPDLVIEIDISNPSLNRIPAVIPAWKRESSRHGWHCKCAKVAGLPSMAAGSRRPSRDDGNPNDRSRNLTK